MCACYCILAASYVIIIIVTVQKKVHKIQIFILHSIVNTMWQIFVHIDSYRA